MESNSFMHHLANNERGIEEINLQIHFTIKGILFVTLLMLEQCS
jgi:hypothetical protein